MTKKLRVCVLQCSTEGSSGVLSEVDPYRKPEVYDTGGEYEWTNVYVRKATSSIQLLELAMSGKYDIYMNLCDGGWDEDRAGMDVVEALERLNLPYTGANPAFFEPSKIDMKMAAQQFGVTVPAWVHIRRFGPMGLEGVERGLAQVLAPLEQGGLRFPLIVKHPSGYSSVGMTKQSKVVNEAELRQQVELLVNQFGGALVEEFVAGREFTVLVVEEPRTGTRTSTDAVVRDGKGVAKSGNDPARNDHGDAVAADACDHQAPAANAAHATNGNGYSTKTINEHGTSAVSAAEAEAEANVNEDLEEDGGGPFRVVSYMPVECAFGAGEDFKHFQLKWHDYDTCTWHPCADPDLAERLKDAARRTFIAMGGISYGRCDFRVDAAGEVYLLEMNSNCGMLYPPGLHGSGDYILTLDPHRDHMHFMRTIIDNGLHRHRLRQPKVIREFVRRPRVAKAASPTGDGDGGETATPAAPSGDRAAAGEWGLVAVVPIRAGEVVHEAEDRPATLVSRGWVERRLTSGGRKRRNFNADAFPLSDEVWVTHADASTWAPLQHSCDPNAWLKGLDVVARRDIEPGEVITIDFATFRVENLAPVACRCGTQSCRGEITGSDHLAPWLTKRYGNHVSAYVAEKRRRLGLDA